MLKQPRCVYQGIYYQGVSDVSVLLVLQENQQQLLPRHVLPTCVNCIRTTCITLARKSVTVTTKTFIQSCQSCIRTGSITQTGRPATAKAYIT